jgi:hypothetical protein
VGDAAPARALVLEELAPSTWGVPPWLNRPPPSPGALFR